MEFHPDHPWGHRYLGERKLEGEAFDVYEAHWGGYLLVRRGANVGVHVEAL